MNRLRVDHFPSGVLDQYPSGARILRTSTLLDTELPQPAPGERFRAAAALPAADL